MLNNENQMQNLLHTILNTNDEVEFSHVMEIIEQHYTFTDSEFTNGDITNLTGQNSGSCKIFSFATLHDLTSKQTLRCFGQFYNDVLATPDKHDHQNIRQFIKTAWMGLTFNGTPLQLKE
jgi:hypothetical protein